MKLATLGNEVKVQGGQQSSSFSIAMNGKAFKVLSDTLYQDKISSIVREVSCNARDSHVSAGKADLPIEIHLPDNFEPWFAVRDFGLGLSPEEVSSVFTVYFGSTKDQSNDTIGAFGLGAKTPFSYTDQFTVTSIKDGILSIYSAYITEDYIPNIRLMHSEETDQENGVEIKMSVNIGDYHKFASAVREQLQFFKVKPAILNHAGFAFKQFAFDYQSENVAIGSQLDYYNKTYIVQGDVGYPADLALLRSKLDVEGVDILSSMERLHVQLNFEIGQIGVTASREAIEYDARTVDNIKDKLKVVSQELSLHLENATKGMNDFQKTEFLNNSPVFRYLFIAGRGTIPNVIKDGHGYYYTLRSSLIENGDSVGYVNKYERSKVRSVIASFYYIRPGQAMIFALKDESKYSALRLKELRKNGDTVFVITPEDKKNPQKVMDHVSEALGGFNNFVKFSEIPVEIQKSKRNSVRSNTPVYYEIHGSMKKFWEKNYTDIEEIQEETLYVVTDGNRTDYDTEVLIDKYFSVVSNLKRMGIEAPKLIAIRRKVYESSEKNENLMALSDFITELKEKYKSENDWEKSYYRHELMRHAVAIIGNQWVNYSDEIAEIASGTDLSRVLTKVSRIQEKIEKSYSDTDSKRSLAVNLGLSLPHMSAAKKQQLERFVKKIVKIKQKYVLLAVKYEPYSKVEVSNEHLAMYVKAVYNGTSV